MNALPQNRFHTLAAALIAAIIVAGFARTYYFAFLFGAPPLTWLMHLHGLTFTAWLVLHFVQARLIARHRYDLHRRFGVAGAFIGLGMIVLGAIAWHGALIRGHAPNGRDPFAFSAVSAITLLEFALFLIAALALRRNREWHKRLMLLASISVLLPAVGRLLGLFIGPSRVSSAVVVTAVVALCFFDDWRHRRRVHPAYLIGGTIIVVTLPLRILVGYTDMWQAFAHWMVAVT
jgi:hypothetical protein